MTRGCVEHEAHSPTAATEGSKAGRGREQGRARGGRSSLDGPLEAVLSRVVDVAFDRALAQALETQARVEPVGVLEARVRPQHQSTDPPLATPLDRALHQGIAKALPPPSRIDVQTMELGRVGVEPL